MNVAVVNPFDPLPGEGFRPGRYGALCRALAARGHRVRWYSSSFWHEFKRRRDEAAVRQAAAEAGFEVTLVASPGYARNTSLGRLRDHAALTRRMRRLWRGGTDRPGVIVVSLPPPSLGAAAADWAERTGARLVVDVQDLWPETFRRFWPRPLRRLNGAVFAGVARDVRRACRRADAVTGVARGYVEHVRPHLRAGTPTEVLPLGVDLEAFDSGVRPPEAFGLNKPEGQRWLFLGGAIRSHIDVTGVAEMMAELARRGRRDVKLVVAAAEETTGPLRAEIERLALKDVRLLGYRPYDQFASVAAAADVGLCPLRAEAMVFLPNRVFDYFAAGLPVLSSLPGELAELLAAHDAGLTVAPGDPADWADAAERLLAAGSPARTDHRQRRGEWVRQLDRRRLAQTFARMIESA